MARLNPTIDYRVFQRLLFDTEQRGECLEWSGARGRGGYGIIRINKVYHRAHRVSYVAFNGPIPDGLIILHSCDNPPCINPEHLRTGTIAENNAEAAERKRYARKGRAGVHQQLNPGFYDRIRGLHSKGGFTASELADLFSIPASQLSKIVLDKKFAGPVYLINKGM